MRSGSQGVGCVLDALRSPDGKQNEVARMPVQHIYRKTATWQQQIKVSGSYGQMLCLSPPASNGNASANSTASGFFASSGFSANCCCNLLDDECSRRSAPHQRHNAQQQWSLRPVVHSDSSSAHRCPHINSVHLHSVRPALLLVGWQSLKAKMAAVDPTSGVLCTWTFILMMMMMMTTTTTKMWMSAGQLKSG